MGFHVTGESSTILPSSQLTVMLRLRGEPEEPQSPTTMLSIQPFPTSSPNEVYDSYPFPSHHGNQLLPQSLRLETEAERRHRSVTVPMTIPLPPPTQPNAFMPPGPSSAGPSYLDSARIMRAPPIVRHASSGNLPTASSGANALRRASSGRRFEPYTGPSSASPRMIVSPSINSPTRQSQSVPEFFAPQPGSRAGSASYAYQAPSTSPGSFPEYYIHSTHHHPVSQQQGGRVQSPPQPQTAPPIYGPGAGYDTTAWSRQAQSHVGRLIPRGYGNGSLSSSDSLGLTGHAVGSSGTHLNGLSGSGGTWGNHQLGMRWEGIGQYS